MIVFHNPPLQQSLCSQDTPQCQVSVAGLQLLHILVTLIKWHCFNQLCASCASSCVMQVNMLRAQQNVYYIAVFTKRRVLTLLEVLVNMDILWRKGYSSWDVLQNNWEEGRMPQGELTAIVEVR